MKFLKLGLAGNIVGLDEVRPPPVTVHGKGVANFASLPGLVDDIPTVERWLAAPDVRPEGYFALGELSPLAVRHWALHRAPGAVVLLVCKARAQSDQRIGYGVAPA